MRHIKRGGLVAVAMSFCFLGSVNAQNAGVQQRLKRLETDMAALKASAAQSSPAELSSRIDALGQRVDTLGRQAESQPDAPKKIDSVEQRLQKLSEDVASLRAGLYSTTPASPSDADSSGLHYGSGLKYTAPDGKFSMRVRGKMQVRYTGVLGQGFSGTKTSSFQVRRARFAWDGHAYSKNLKYKLGLAFEKGKVGLNDFFIVGRLPFGLKIKVGQFKVPFSRAYLVSSSVQWFLERPSADGYFRYDRDLGLELAYAEGPFQVRLAVVNGAGKNVSGNDNIDPLLVLRADFAVLGKLGKMVVGDMANSSSPQLTVGAAVAFENMLVPEEYGYKGLAPATAEILIRDVDGDGDDDNVQVMQATADMAFRLHGVGVEAGAYARKEDWGSIGTANGFDPATTYYGGYFQASTFIVPQRFQLGALAAYSQVSPLLVAGRTHNPVSDARLELTFAAAYYRFGNNIELTTTYSFFRWLAQEGSVMGDTDEHRLLIETQLLF